MLAAMKLMLKWLLSAGALLLVAAVFSGVQVQSYGSALLAALVIGLLNALVRPVLVILTLPVTLITVAKAISMPKLNAMPKKACGMAKKRLVNG